tara:strand:- start:1588 stop:2313 length:726 start_codon:yes stop_codon:yes gene_type:complete
MIEKIIGGVAVLLAIYLIYVLLKYFKFFENVNLSGLEKTTEVYEVGPSKWAPGGIADPNYTLSIWFYVSSWEGDNQGQDKYIFSREYDQQVSDVEAYLGANTNDLTVKFLAADNNTTTSCVINNVPLQKWVHLAVAKYNNVIDIYIDGKLAKTCAGAETGSITPKLNSINLHASSGSTTSQSFDGYTTHMKYFNSTLGPVEIYNIYRNGYGGSWLDSLLGGYTMRMSVLKNDQEIAGIGLG